MFLNGEKNKQKQTTTTTKHTSVSILALIHYFCAFILSVCDTMQCKKSKNCEYKNQQNSKEICTWFKFLLLFVLFCSFVCFLCFCLFLLFFNSPPPIFIALYLGLVGGEKHTEATTSPFLSQLLIHVYNKDLNFYEQNVHYYSITSGNVF